MSRPLRWPLAGLALLTAAPRLALAQAGPDLEVTAVTIEEVLDKGVDVAITVRNASLLPTGEIDVELRAWLSLDPSLERRHEEVGRWTVPLFLRRGDSLTVPLRIRGPFTHDPRCYPFLVGGLRFDAEIDSDPDDNLAVTDLAGCDEVDPPEESPRIEPDLPSGFVVQNTWWARDLGLPDRLGAMLIPPGSSRMLVVTAADTYDSAVYSLAITRNAAGRVTTLGDARREWDVATDDPVAGAIGIGAGLEIGDDGRLSYTTWGENELRERPYDPDRSFSPSERVVLNLDATVSGLTRSPQRDEWLVGTQPDGRLWLLPESDFLRYSTRAFATLDRPAGGLDFVPDGPWEGDLLYADWLSGEIRRIVVDDDTGYPFDALTGLPRPGTRDPIVETFARGFGRGPSGLEFDTRTDDLFVSTWSHDGDDRIVQIHGEALQLDGPIVEDIELSTVSGEPVELRLLGFDADTPTLRYEILGELRLGELRGDPPDLVYEPTVNVLFSEKEIFGYVATDGTYTSEPGTITIDVFPRPECGCAQTGPSSLWLLAVAGIAARRRHRVA